MKPSVKPLVSYKFEITNKKTKSDKMASLVAELIKHPPVEIPERHYFSDGIYAREITIPKGACIVGAVHKTNHLCTMSKGHLVIDAGDNGITELIGHCTFESKAWSQKAATALEETVFTTYHATDEKDVDKLVEILTTITADEVLGKSKNLQTLANKKIEVKP